MRKYLIDSDILIDFFRYRSEIIALLRQLHEKGSLAISVLSIAEIRSGWSEQESSIYLPELYNIAKDEPVTRNIAQLAGQYRHHYKKKGITLQTVDTIIAATAILGNYQLVTRNKKDYPMKEVSIYPL